jgi:hypothetical protein
MKTRTIRELSGFLATFLVLFYSSSTIWSASQDAAEIRIHEARGTPAEIVMPDGSKPQIRVDDVIPQGALVRTPKNSFLSLIFSNGALVLVKPLSEVLISRFTSEAPMDFQSGAIGHAGAETSNSSTRLNLKSGLIMLDIPRLKPRSEFEIVTPVGIAGIRGTRLFVMVQKDRGAIGVSAGRVLATSLVGETQALGPGQAVGLSTTGLVKPTVAEMSLIPEIEANFAATPSPRGFRNPPPPRKTGQTTTRVSRATYQTSE